MKLRSLPFLLSLLSLALASTGQAARPRAGDELLTALQARLEARAEIDDLVDALDDVPPPELRALEPQVEKAWAAQLEMYLEAFKKAADSQLAGSARSANNQEVGKLRKDFHEVYNMGEAVMKKGLEEKSWPAVQKLRALLLPNSKDLAAKAGETLAAQRARLLILAEFRNGLLEVRVSLSPQYGAEELATAETGIMDEYSRLDRDGLRIMKSNASLAEREELPPAEVEGIRQLNEMRLLVGLSALAIDAKLCEASRDHSKDMAEHGFFSHTSPIKGKETPSQRAALAGTSGGGENIFMGSPSPEAANRGWFFSPGHHKNMFGGGYRRIGLGQHGSHWTQMFGR